MRKLRVIKMPGEIHLRLTMHEGMVQNHVPNSVEDMSRLIKLLKGIANYEVQSSCYEAVGIIYKRKR
jgi:hypothetical protein